MIWDRSGEGDPVVRPTAFGSYDGGRSGGKPAENVARLAHLYARLWQATGKPLHRAKAEALLGSLLAGQNPETGELPVELEAKASIDPRRGKTFQPAHPMQRYGLTLWEMLAAAEALAAREEEIKKP